MALSDAIVKGMAEAPLQKWMREMQAERQERVRKQRAAQVMAARATWLREARRAETPPDPTLFEREALFPPCLRADCERRGTKHSELLPHQAEGFGASERFIAMLGGYGSAKTQWAVAVGVALTLQIPGNVGFVLRRSYPKLRDSVLRVYLETLERVGVAYETAEHEQGMPLRVVVPATGSEIRFRESTQLSRLLSTECGWFHLEEAWEEPKSTWAHLVGRLRLRGAFGYLKGLITSNPPSHQHWIADVFGLVPGPQRRVDEATGDAFTTRLIQVSLLRQPAFAAGLRGGVEDDACRARRPAPGRGAVRVRGGRGAGVSAVPARAPRAGRAGARHVHRAGVGFWVSRPGGRLVAVPEVL